MKRNLIRSGCAACALVLMISSSPISTFAAEQNGPGAAAASPEEGPVEIRQEKLDRLKEVTEEDIDAFFDNLVFVGDSVMLGYRNYAMTKKGTWLERPQFLASVSFSTYNALRPVTAKSLHPVYAGQKRLVEDSIALMGARKVFLFFGLNDIGISGINGTAENYVELVNRIKAQSPNVEIHLMSMTYTVRGKGKGNLYNDNVRRYNDTMRALAAQQGWGFVDVCTPLADANGDLAASYSSDNYVHLKNSAYDVWSVVLRNYAKSVLEAERLHPGEEPVQDGANLMPEAVFDAGPGDAARDTSGPGADGAGGSAAGPGGAGSSESAAGSDGTGGSESTAGSGGAGSGSAAGPGYTNGQTGTADAAAGESQTGPGAAGSSDPAQPGN